jgi:hypothetical protein
MKNSTVEKIIQQLQVRIGDFVSQYEAELAIVRAQAQEAVEEKDRQIAELQSKLGGIDSEPGNPRDS